MAKTAYQKIKKKKKKNKSPNNRMMLFGESVVWMMLKDNNRRIQLEPLHQYGVFAGIVPRTGECIVPTPEGAIARTLRRLSEDKRWDAELVSRTKGTPWGFKLTPDKPNGESDEGQVAGCDPRGGCRWKNAKGAQDSSRDHKQPWHDPKAVHIVSACVVSHHIWRLHGPYHLFFSLSRVEKGKIIKVVIPMGCRPIGQTQRHLTCFLRTLEITRDNPLPSSLGREPNKFSRELISGSLLGSMRTDIGDDKRLTNTIHHD